MVIRLYWPMTILASELIRAGVSKDQAAVVIGHTYPITNGNEHYLELSVVDGHPIRFGAFALSPDQWDPAQPLRGPLLRSQAEAVLRALTAVGGHAADLYDGWGPILPWVRSDALWAVDHPQTSITDPRIMATAQLGPPRNR